MSEPNSPGEIDPEDLIAQSLSQSLGNCEILSKLGQGGMGAVYKAHQPRLDRMVAIKVLTPVENEDSEGMRFSERFEREARSMAKLGHPNIISVFDFGETSDGLLYIVMEFVEGWDLHQLIRGGELSPDHLLSWIPQVCEALQYAHQKGIVHRDIKPANIMISNEGEIKVADFGLAKLMDGNDPDSFSLTMSGAAVGTPIYVAPESLDDEGVVDHRADIYALGVMMYEMLTGKLPSGVWQTPCEQDTHLDPRFDEVVLNAMVPEPDGRYHDVSQISGMLESIAAGAPPAQRPKLIVGSAADSVPRSTGLSSPAARSRNIGLQKKSASEISSLQSSAAPRSPLPDQPKKGSPMKWLLPLIAILIVGGVLAAVFGKKDEPDPIAESKPPAAKPSLHQPKPVEKKPEPTTTPSQPAPPKAVAKTLNDLPKADPKNFIIPPPKFPPERPPVPCRLVLFSLEHENPQKPHSASTLIEEDGLTDIVSLTIEGNHRHNQSTIGYLRSDGSVGGYSPDKTFQNLLDQYAGKKGAQLSFGYLANGINIVNIDGTADNIGYEKKVHLKIDDLTNVSSVSSFFYDTCFLTKNGKIHPWGRLKREQSPLYQSLVSLNDVAVNFSGNIYLRDGKLVYLDKNGVVSPRPKERNFDGHALRAGPYFVILKDGFALHNHWGVEMAAWKPFQGKIKNISLGKGLNHLGGLLNGELLHLVDGNWIVLRKGKPPQQPESARDELTEKALNGAIEVKYMWGVVYALFPAETVPRSGWWTTQELIDAKTK